MEGISEIVDLYNKTQSNSAGLPFPIIGNSMFSSMKAMVNMMFLKINELETNCQGYPSSARSDKGAHPTVGSLLTGLSGGERRSAKGFDVSQKISPIPSPTSSVDCLFSKKNLEKVSKKRTGHSSPVVKKLRPLSSPKLCASLTQNLFENFNKLPKSPSPKFAYKPDRAVRKKDVRKKLPGNICEQCKKYYESLKDTFTKAEIQYIIQKCSKHRSKFVANPSGTPPDYWGVDFPNTQECIDKGLLGIGRESQRYQ